MALLIRVKKLKLKTQGEKTYGHRCDLNYENKTKFSVFF